MGLAVTLTMPPSTPCHHCGCSARGVEIVFHSYITHNLGEMAEEATIYDALWRPEEIGITHAKHLIQPLQTGLEFLLDVPDRFKALNPENGWGNYDNLVEFVENYLRACEKYPETLVAADR